MLRWESDDDDDTSRNNWRCAIEVKCRRWEKWDEGSSFQGSTAIENTKNAANKKRRNNCQQVHPGRSSWWLCLISVPPPSSSSIFRMDLKIQESRRERDRGTLQSTNWLYISRDDDSSWHNSWLLSPDGTQHTHTRWWWWCIVHVHTHTHRSDDLFFFLPEFFC